MEAPGHACISRRSLAPRIQTSRRLAEIEPGRAPIRLEIRSGGYHSRIESRARYAGVARQEGQNQPARGTRWRSRAPPLSVR
jgi:hypothetical protein